MSRHDDQRLHDILAAADAIADHVGRGGLEDGLVFDAVRVRLIEIGEAVKGIDRDLLAREPGIPWVDVAAMRNHLACWMVCGRAVSPELGAHRVQ